uniref:Uncharacterized protein n=1 Tax=Siphoviridae sp. ct2hZ16 TaxID=2826276 RepID=A0A8S5QUC7_9CAUD|nr:MAG TPA: hypothetical protein [Siphoviridae sp. ct2hZ16]
MLDMPKLSVRALMSALPYRIKQYNEDKIYKLYMSDVLMSLATNIIRPDEKPPRYWDMIRPEKPEKEEMRTEEEIIEHIKNKLREVS